MSQESNFLKKTLFIVFGVTVRRTLPWPPNKHFLQVSQSGSSTLIDRHASIKGFQHLSIETDKVEAKAQQLYKTRKIAFVVICSLNCKNNWLN